MTATARPSRLHQRDRIVWIVNHYASHLERDGRATRHQHLASGLSRHGWHAVVIAASTEHPVGRQTFPAARLRQRWFGQDHEYLWLRGVSYAGNGLRRVLDILLFTILLLLPGSTRGLPRPDVVIGGSFHPLAAWAAARIARRHGARFVFEPRDLWPESIVAFGTLTERSLITRALRRLERDIVSRADLIVSPLDGVGRYYEALGYDTPFLWISNGIACDDAELSSGNSRDQMPAGDAPFVITYLGAMGPANALEEIIDAFDLANRRAPDIGLELRLVGSGPAMGALQERAAKLSSRDQVTFCGRMAQADARKVGLQSDCLVANMHDLRLYDHGVSLNKVFEYMLIGRPVIVGVTRPIEPIADARAGLQVGASDVEALADAMVALSRTMPEERRAMGMRARALVKQNYDYEVLAGTLARGLDNLLADH